MKQIRYIRWINLILVACWMTTVFWFSNQEAEASSKTSGTVSNLIIKTIPVSNNLSSMQRQELAEQIETPIRKLAHFSVYTIGGFLLINLLNTYEISQKRKIGISFLLGTCYAITDEFHQFFVPGRSCELRDVVIDASGVLLGISIVVISYYVIKKIKGVKK